MSAVLPFVPADQQPPYIAAARAKLVKLTWGQLVEAKVFKRVMPDTTNPGGYFHLVVYVEVRSLFGLRRDIELYRCECSADNFEQVAVYEHTRALVDAVRKLLA